MFNKRPLPLPDFLANLQTFDIVLMHGLFPSSLAVESVEGSDWSHVGIVVVANDIGLTTVPPQTRLFWESNTIDAPTTPVKRPQAKDVILNVAKNGPQLTMLSERISHNLTVNFDSNFAARKLIYPRKAAQFTILNNVIKAVHSASFPGASAGDQSDGELQNFILGRFKSQPVNDGTFFCSQLVAHTFKALGLLTQAYVDNSYAPVDFSEALDVSLLNGAWFGREIMLDSSTIPPQPAGPPTP